MTAHDVTDEQRTYGNWRKPGGGGLFGLGKTATYTGLGVASVAMILMIYAGAIPAFGLLLVGLVVIAIGSIRLPHGRTALQSVAPRAAHGRARYTGQTKHRGGPLSRNPDATFTLPGLAASTRLSEGVDAQGRRFAIVTLPKRSHTIVLIADPDGAALVDDDAIDEWVARWGAWLTSLGDEPGLLAVSVTVETSPDSGERLRRELDATTVPTAPVVAAAMLKEIASTYTTGSATVRVYVAMTFRVTRGQYREDTVRELSMRAAHFASGLHGTGAGAARPRSAQELCEVIRTAYDPVSAATFDDARAHGTVAELDWADVGPAAADESYGSYAHDSGTSITWAMTQAPLANVPAEVLTRLLKPHPEIARKRVTLLYRPIDPGRAARLVEADKRDAEATVRNVNRPTEWMKVELLSAEATGREQAKGAGLLNFGMLITATVDDSTRLDTAKRVIEQLAPTARIRTRILYGGQEAAFAACLPLGIVLPAHKRSTRIKEGL
jgi:hypothetical protein